MELTTLEKFPHRINELLDLIQKAFNYSSDNSFEIDFLPLVDRDNFKNLHIIIDSNKIVAHAGVLKKRFNLLSESGPEVSSEYDFTFIGGVAVEAAYRGRGLSKKLFHKIFNSYKETTAFILWSDKFDYYKKFNFHPCIEQFEYQKREGQGRFVKHPISSINLIKDHLYSRAFELRPIREEKNWTKISKMESVELYLKYNSDNLVQNYFLKNKGEDLNDIIHEYGYPEEELTYYGKLWASSKISSLEMTAQFSSLLRIGSKNTFKRFIKDYTHNKISLLRLGDKDVRFKYLNEEITVTQADFLTGILGPSRFKELTHLRPFYIPGVESI